MGSFEKLTRQIHFLYNCLQVSKPISKKTKTIEWDIFQQFQKTKKKKSKSLSFLLPFTGCRKVHEEMPVWELQLTQISLNFKTCYNWKIRGVGAKLRWLYYYVKFERNYDIPWQSERVCILMNENRNFNKNEAKSKTENHTQVKRDKPCASAHTGITNEK